MTIYDRLKKGINSRINKGLLDDFYVEKTKNQTANFQLSQQAQSANIISTLQPTPKPAYLTCSPYYAYNSGACFGNGCGCNGTNL